MEEARCGIRLREFQYLLHSGKEQHSNLDGEENPGSETGAGDARAIESDEGGEEPAQINESDDRLGAAELVAWEATAAKQNIFKQHERAGCQGNGAECPKIVAHIVSQGQR